MENNDSVCYINRINKIEAISGADNIVLATVNGWNSVVQKGIHQEGDLVLCITTDAVIPQELADKWGVASYLRKGNRVRTVKLRGVYSECVLIPRKDTFETIQGFWEGQDRMSLYNIFKYEEPVREVVLHGGKRVKMKDNPNFNKYYKFPNYKNTPHMFTEDDIVVITRKIHGTNARYGIVKKTKLTIWDRIKKFFTKDKWIDFEYVYGSHNVQKGSDSQGFYDVDIWAEIANRYDIKNKLWKWVKEHPDTFKEGLIIYGEIYGPGIQGEKYSYNKKMHEIALFDIELNKEYVSRWFFDDIIIGLNLPTVEYLYRGPWRIKLHDKYVLNQFIEGTDIPHEGIVVSAINGDRHKISKIINPEYHTFSEKHLIPDSH